MKLDQTWQQNQTYMNAQAEFTITTPIPKFIGLKSVFEQSGNLVVRASLEGTVRYFLQTLEKDYQAWARDDPNRDKWVVKE